MSRPTLYGIRYSPWTERARWALEHHHVDFRYVEHVPLLGEPLLRLRARGASKVATVPLMVVDGRILGDSYAIIRYADEVGGGAPLAAAAPEVTAWAERLEPCLHAGRVRVTRRTLRDPAALKEAATAAAPPFAAGLLRPLAAVGARYIGLKYGFDATASDDEREALEVGLDALRAAIGGGPYVLDRFTAADIVGATFLQAVRPVEGYIELGPATHRIWHDEGLAEAYADLLAWRDRIYAAHRRPAG